MRIFLGFSCDCIFVYTPSTSVFNSSIRGLRTTPIDLFCNNNLVCRLISESCPFVQFSDFKLLVQFFEELVHPSLLFDQQ